MEKQDFTPYIIGIVALLLGFALCFTASTRMLSLQIKANSYIKTDAIIIDVEPHSTWDYDKEAYVTVLYNLIEYDVNGKK